MKTKNMSSHFPWLALALALALAAVTNCSSTSNVGPATTASAGSETEAEAGAGGNAGEAPVIATLCGVKAEFSQCDPISGSPCNIAGGDICEHSAALGGFKCYSGLPLAGPGKFCDEQTAFCGPGTTCDNFTQQCTHYCCVDSDCAHGPCTPGVDTDGAAKMGICVGEYGSPEGGAGGSGG